MRFHCKTIGKKYNNITDYWGRAGGERGEVEMMALTNGTIFFVYQLDNHNKNLIKKSNMCVQV